MNSFQGVLGFFGADLRPDLEAKLEPHAPSNQVTRLWTVRQTTRQLLGWLFMVLLTALMAPTFAATTTTALTSSPNPSIPWSSVTFTATVTGNAPTGVVTFMDGANTLGSGTLSGSGDSRTASIASGALDAGVHSITAVYAGDALNSTSTSPALSQNVGAATVTTTTTSLVSNPNPSIPWASVTFTATVTGNAPSGTVTFMDGANTLGSGPLSGTGNSRTVSIVSGALDTGVHSITAVYAGDSLNSTSTSPALSQNVGAATVTTTTTSLASNPNPSIPWASVTFTATVTGNAPSGTVTFKDGVNSLGSGTLSGTGNSRTVSIVSGALDTGVHSITAVYTGDSLNSSSTSPALSQNVGAATVTTTTTSLASNPNPSIPWSSVTFTATVTGNAPSGTVTFRDGANTLGSGPLSGTGNSRSVSIVSGALDTGVHSITAVYAGDAQNSTSTSPALSQSVGAATVTTTTTALASNPNPSIPWSSVTFTATVTGNAPSGTVTFKDGANTLGSGPLSGTGNSRTVSIVSGALDTGIHSITAVYAGDTLNTASTSPTLSQSVGAAGSPASTTTALVSGTNPSSLGQSVTLTASITGNAPSGTVTFKDGAATLGTGTVSAGAATLAISSLPTGSHSLTAVYGGDAGNATSTSAAVAQVVNQSVSTTTLASSANPATFGQNVTLTATVAGQSPTGTVTFKDGASVLGTGTIAAGVATLATAALSTGPHNLTAVYAGDGNNAGSTSNALAQTVNVAASTTTLTASANPSTFGTSITLTATIGGAAPSGTVTFKDGASVLGTGTIAAGVATLATSTLTTGSHTLTAVYGGDGNNVASTSAVVAQVVNQSVTTTTLASSANPSTFGQNVTLTATVAGQSPSGTVTFMEGAAMLGTGTMTAGVATFSTSTIALGGHNITAVYGGDTNNATSTSTALTQTVNLVASTTTLSSSANPSISGGSVTLTATVTGATPTGTVTFKDGALTLGTGPVSAGVATLGASSLSTGSHTLTAVYGGDTNNAPSTSSAVIQVVNQAASSIALAASANPSTFGTSITLTATIGGATPGGTITFMDAASVLGTGTIAAGVATLATSTLTTGSHTLTAVYGGDGNNAGSTSALLTQTVNAAIVSTTTGLQATPNPAGAGQSVTLTATISGNNPGGSVSFMDGATLLGSGTVSAGVAAFSTATLTAGSHNLTAVYGGDAGNLASTSAALSLIVNAAGPGAMTWKYGYDAMGRLTSTIDPNGLTSYTYYDSLGRPIQTQQPANVGAASPTVTQFDYNLADSLTAVTDPRNLGTSYAPNGLGKVTAQTSPDSGASQYTYDAKGNVLSSTDARGKTRQYAYDALDRLISVSYPTGVATVLEYDGGATPTPAAKGELTKVTDESGSASYSYDALGRMTGKTQVTNGKSFTVSYTWGDTGSALDKLIGITYPGGSRVNYSYDAQGAVSGISVNPGNASGVGTNTSSTLMLLSGINYNADNSITGWSWSDGKARSIAYDSFGLIASYSLGDQAGTGASAGELRTLVRDAAGRITGYTHTNSAVAQPSLDQTFGYDNLNRLLSATLASSSTQYSYDANGNRTAKTVGATSYVNTIAATSNRLVQTQDVGGTAIVQHDSAGNIINDGTNSFTYSDRGRMSLATNAGGSVNYLYNALELRVAKSGPGALVPTGAAYYVYNESGQLLGEYDANQTPIYETVYLGQTPVGVMTQTGTPAGNNIAVTLYNVHADHMATARIITRQTDQAIVWRWDTAEAFGATAADQNPSGLGTFVYNQRFPGQVFDAETGLNQNWHREYDPRQGRYRQSDPIGLAGGINTFSYVSGNPLSLMDREGLQSLTTDIKGGVTTFNPMPYPGQPFSIPTSTSSARRSDPTANQGFQTPDVVGIRRKGDTTEFGPDGTVIDVGDKRGRHIHGGGSCKAVDDPYARRQGWCVTLGCTRGQNEDVQNLWNRIQEFKRANPGVKIPYLRY